MKVLSEEYKNCVGMNNIFCEQCDDKRMKMVISYGCGEMVISVAGMGKNCIEHSCSSYRVGSSVR